MGLVPDFEGVMTQHDPPRVVLHLVVVLYPLEAALDGATEVPVVVVAHDVEDDAVERVEDLQCLGILMERQISEVVDMVSLADDFVPPGDHALVHLLYRGERTTTEIDDLGMTKVVVTGISGNAAAVAGAGMTCGTNVFDDTIMMVSFVQRRINASSTRNESFARRID